MRILHLTTEFPPVIYGGLGTAVGGLVNASLRSGMEVRVFLVGEGGQEGYEHVSSAPCSLAEDQDLPQNDATNVSVHRSGYSTALQNAVALVHSWQPDIIHLHCFWIAHIAHALQQQTGTPLVYTVHSLDKAEYEIGHGPPECMSQWDTQAFIINVADRVIALTEEEGRLIETYCPGTRARVRVVGNGISDSPSARQAAGRSRTNPDSVVLYSGRFVERKGIGQLLDAIPSILAQVPNSRFVLAGGHRHCSGADMEQRWLPDTVIPFRDRIHFTGWLAPDELDLWYRAADILVVPSWYEPFGMVVLEGMLNGLAVIAADVGGPREILHHGRTGLLFAPQDSAALTVTVVRLLRDHALRRQLAKSAAAEVRTMWLWPRVVQSMRAVYDDAIVPLSGHAANG